MHGKFLWNELMTRNVDEARAFYEKLAGWRFEANPLPDGGTYWVAWSGEERAAGIFDMSVADFGAMGDQWVAYLGVENVDDSVTQATAAGASVMRAPFDIPGVGRIAYLHDKGGSIVALMTPHI